MRAFEKVKASSTSKQHNALALQCPHRQTLPKLPTGTELTTKLIKMTVSKLLLAFMLLLAVTATMAQLPAQSVATACGPTLAKQIKAHATPCYKTIANANTCPAQCKAMIAKIGTNGACGMAFAQTSPKASVAAVKKVSYMPHTSPVLRGSKFQASPLTHGMHSSHAALHGRSGRPWRRSDGSWWSLKANFGKSDCSQPSC